MFFVVFFEKQKLALCSCGICSVSWAGSLFALSPVSYLKQCSISRMLTVRLYLYLNASGIAVYKTHSVGTAK